MKTLTPPATWNDLKTCRQEYKLWYGFRHFSCEEQHISVDSFRRGWKAGARIATIEMWKWINRVVFRHEFTSETEKESPDLILTEKQVQILTQIENVASQLIGTSEAIEDSVNPDAILRHVCREGSKRLNNILASMENQ